MWRKKRKTTSHTVSTLNWWGDLELYDLFMQGSPRSIFFLSFFPTKFFYSHFYIKTAALYQFHVSSFRDLPKVKRNHPGETHILFYFVYFVFFILFLLLLFAVVVVFFFWQTKCAHEKKKINLTANYVFWPAAQDFSRFARFRWGRCYFNQSKRCISTLFPLPTSPRNDKMHK